MSYILDALKKADQERELGKVPGLEAAQPASSDPQSRRWHWVVGIGVLLNALLMFAFWLNASDDDEPEAAIVAILPSGGQSPQAAPVEAPGHGDVQLTVPREQVPEVPARNAADSDRPPLRFLPLPAPQPVTVAEPASMPIATSGDLTPMVSAEKPPLNAVAERAIAPPQQRAAGESSDSQNLPVWPQVSGSVAKQVDGTLTLNMHVYSDSAGERFVLINARKYREGHTLPEGPAVQRIVPKGVILAVPAGRFVLPTR